ncbi:MAG TPA: DMT family transporter [Burkholderiales bacterium]|nr:DMT family transporter [Burkholderiales bacterium]
MAGWLHRWSAAAPGLFVVLWSTGFIGAKAGVPYAEPFTFLALRFVIVIAVMLPLALALRARWPATRRETAHIAAAGALLQGGYLAGCFAAVYHGMPAGLVSLIVGLQPVVTAFAAAPLLGERLAPAQWAGLALGFGGVLLVLWDKFSLRGLDGLSVAWSLIALSSITAGTLYQKRYCPRFDLRAGSVIQFGAALLLLLPLAFVTETMRVTWSGEFAFALGWLALVLSIGAISLLFYLIEHGEATRVSSLFYLTPLTTAAMAYGFFGETLTARALAGAVIGIAGVALVVRKPGLATPEP